MSLVKNLYFDVAKQRVLDPTARLYIGQRGSDRLEGEFGQWRTMDHNRNMDLLQLGNHGGPSSHMSKIFAGHPDWDRGHRQLKLESAEGVDHTNPKFWTGDVIVANVSLLTSWNSGRSQAITILQELDLLGAGNLFDIMHTATGDPVNML